MRDWLNAAVCRLLCREPADALAGLYIVELDKYRVENFHLVINSWALRTASQLISPSLFHQSF